MNREQLQGNWLILKGRIKEKWGQLTNDELDVVDGQLDQLAGTISRRYGIAKQQAADDLEALCRRELEH